MKYNCDRKICCTSIELRKVYNNITDGFQVVLLWKTAKLVKIVIQFASKFTRVKLKRGCTFIIRLDRTDDLHHL